MDNTTKPIKQGRLLSLDVFRGATIAAMLLVNNAGDWGNVFPPLDHAEWHGCTATDLIFPFFLFIMGVAMTFSFGKRLSAGADKKDMFVQIIKRSVILYALGCIIMIFVWQGLGKPYKPVRSTSANSTSVIFSASIIIMYSGMRGQFRWFVGLLGLHYILLKFVPFPGHEAGVLEKYINISDWFDTQILGRHLASFNEQLRDWS